MTARVLSGYRRLFRARKILFTGDHRAMTESRLAIRAQFDSNRNINVDVMSPQGQSHMEGLITMIDEAEDMLLHGIARGTLNEQKGHYEVKIRPEQATRIGEDDSVGGTIVEPITAETGEDVPKVTVTTSSSSTSCSNGCGSGGKHSSS